MTNRIKQLLKTLLNLIIVLVVLVIFGSVMLIFVNSLGTMTEGLFNNILMIVLSLGGLVGLYFFIKSILEMMVSNRWPSVDGEIVSSYLGTQRGEDQLYYQPVITYSYNVDGRDYQAKRVVIGQIPINTGKDWAEKKVNNYQPGKRVNVYYNPKAPQKAVLEPGWNSQLLLLWFGITLVGGFLIICISFLITWLVLFFGNFF